MAKQVEITGLRATIAELKRLPDNALNELRKEMRSQIKPELKGIRNFIKIAESRLRASGSTSGKPANVFSNGRTGWSGANVALEFRPSKYKGAILSIRADGKKKQFGYNMAEMATGSKQKSPRGRAYAAMLTKRFDWEGQGRFLYRSTINQIDSIYYKVAKVLFRYSEKVNVKLERNIL
jgi:hypothetical protein